LAILTVSRLYGSGGSEVAAIVARTLGWSLLDNAVVDAVAARMGLSVAEVQAREERVPSLVERLTAAMAMGSQEWVSPMAAVKRPTDEQLIEVTHRIIEEAIARGPLVVVGRGTQEMLAERGLHDHNDVIDLALAELRRQPLETRYAAVVVDEVQDITLNGLRLIKELAGTGPNQLLLVGDGQQQVYPGGWRLSDAGIPVLGRGEVLRVNYRNRTEVLAFAQRFDAVDEVDDLDGESGIALKNAEAGNTGGTAVSWRGTEAELAAELTRRIAGLTAPLGQTALILFQRQDLVRCRRILREAGVPVLSLDDYSGAPDDHLKVGTVHRAKGLDFQAVLVVEFPGKPGESGAAAEEATRLRDRQRLVAATRARDFLWWGIVDGIADTAGAAG